MKVVWKIAFLIPLVISLFVTIHNVWVYDVFKGIDARGHIEYIDFLTTNHALPLPDQGWELHQPPLYYLLAAFIKIGFGFKAVQFINLVVFYLIVLVIVFGSRLFVKDTRALFITYLSALSLPVLNYLVPLITNELLSALFIISTLVVLIKSYLSSKEKDFLYWFGLGCILFVLAFYTKYTALTLVPVFGVVLIVKFLGKLSIKTKQVSILFVLAAFILISPVFYRNYTHYHKFLVGPQDFSNYITESHKPRDFVFFSRLDWIYPVDLYRSHHYSFLGGLYNSFWHDGQNIITPVVEFHKKAFGLWLLGFLISLFVVLGQLILFKKDKKISLILFTFILSSFGALILYNFVVPDYFSVKIFYILGISFIYCILLAQTVRYVLLSKLLILLLFVQFSMMCSYFYL